ncbi:lipoprotein insertase outer membrane protein LolB [Ottowia sp.]|uniref:lipoprotein insertase outer membrane protein LolB n=1 Tax=Ottowia sp. TaxID=1898956 RepID=UPI0039E7150A
MTARAAVWAGLLIAILFIAGCASQSGAGGTFDQKSEHWSGRLGLTVDSEPPQSYSAGFTLLGNPQAGEFSLSSPLGSTLAVMQWRPGQALLRQGEQTRSFASLDELAAAVTGTPLPVRALFGWLNGTPQAVEGWDADLSRLEAGRLTARRLMPLPTAELRVVLDR